MHQHAERELRAIRTAMARAGSFTALPGWGGMGMGLIGLSAAIGGAFSTDPNDWLDAWLLAAALAVPLGAVTLWLTFFPSPAYKRYVERKWSRSPDDAEVARLG